MTVQIEMPRLSSEDEGATLATWLVSVGDQVEKGDVIAELETDKATVELEAPATGTILEFLVQEGDEGIMPGAVLGMLDADDASGSIELSETSPKDSTAGPEKAGEMSPSPVPKRLPDDDLDLKGSTPLARRAAAGRNVDLSALAGSENAKTSNGSVFPC